MERSMVRSAAPSGAAITTAADGSLCAAQVVDPDTGGEKLDDIRTSFGTFLARGETDIIRQVELRVAEWAQVPEENAEQLQILRCVVAITQGRSAVHKKRLTLRAALAATASGSSTTTTGTGSTARRLTCVLAQRRVLQRG